MKKILTLALVLALALSLAAPALAFWGTAPTTAAAGGTTVDIYLVDHDGSGSLLSGLISMPATNRGYAKNEIVAAVASLMIPANVDVTVAGLGYDEFVLSGSSVSVNVTDNLVAGFVDIVTTFPAGVTENFNATSSAILLNIGVLTPAATTASTYRALYFAKVVGDDATMTATLTRNLALGAGVGAVMPLGNTGYQVTRTLAAGAVPQEYIISEVATGNDLFTIRTNAAGLAESIEVTPQSMAGATEWFGVVYSGGYLYTLTQTAGAPINLGRVPTAAEQLVLDSRMNSIFATALGLDITKRGYNMSDANWAAYANSLANLSESVDVEPWTPYVTVPDNIVVDPPKTGDAASILGFVMIALAGAAVVAVKKVRA